MFKISLKKKRIVAPKMIIPSYITVDYTGHQCFTYSKVDSRNSRVSHYIYDVLIDKWVYYGTYSWIEYEKVKQLLTT